MRYLPLLLTVALATACSDSDSSSPAAHLAAGRIGPDGGSVSVTEGDLAGSTIRVDAGVLSDTYRFWIDPGEALAGAGGTAAVGPAVTIGVDGEPDLAGALAVTIGYDASQLPPGATTGHLRVITTNPESGQRMVFAPESVDETAGMVTFSTSATGTFQVVVNLSVHASADSRTLDEDETSLWDAPGVLGNDTDDDGGALRALVVRDVTQGTLLLEPDGSFRYTPPADWSGQTSFRYEVRDLYGGFDQADVQLTVISVNDAPTADAQTLSTDEDTPLDLTLTGSDADGDSLTYTVASNPANGTLSGVPPTLTYTPEPDFAGNDVFSFVAHDGSLDSDAATVEISVAPLADPPIARDDHVRASAGLLLTIDALANDSDPDGDPLTITQNYGSTRIGTVSLSDNLFDYLAPAGSSGPDSFTYEIVDGTGGWDEATINVDVFAPPEAADEALVTYFDDPLSFTLSVTDPVGDGLLYNITTSPAYGTLSGTLPDLTYTPNSGYVGNDAFSYRVTDALGAVAGATVTIIVSDNHRPIADDLAVSTFEDDSVAVTLSATDGDGDALSYRVVTQPDFGTLSGTPPHLTYTPDPDYDGSDLFSYVANDGICDSRTAYVSIGISATEDAPVAHDDSAATWRDEPVEINVLANDTDADGDVRTICDLTTPALGSVAVSGSLLIYTPSAGESGVDTFDYQIHDGTGLYDWGTVTVNIQASPVRMEQAAGTGVAFDMHEFRIQLDAAQLPVGSLQTTEVFNAYDPARNRAEVCIVVGRRALSAAEIDAAILELDNTTSPMPTIYDTVNDAFALPAFHARYSAAETVAEPAESWRWRARFTPLDPGTYHIYACARITPVSGTAAAFPDSAGTQTPAWTHANFAPAVYVLAIDAPAANTPGPWLPQSEAPTSDRSQRYFHRTEWSGAVRRARPLFVRGHCRAWNTKHEGTLRWDSAYIPLDALTANLAAHGGNLLSWWMVSWDTAPVHGPGPKADEFEALKYKEQWDEVGPDGRYEAKEISAEVSLVDQPYLFFDQGRCAKLDALFDAAEAQDIGIMLTFFPHVDLREPGTSWDQFATYDRYGEEWINCMGHWCDESTPITQAGHTGTVDPNDGTFNGWAWQQLTPNEFVAAFDSAEGVHFRNFLRYAVARWGSRPGLATWELISEINGTYISAAEESAWRDRVESFMGAVSPYRQPLSSSTHNITWGGGDIADGDYVSTHGYCRVDDGTTSGVMNNDELDQGRLFHDNASYRDSVLSEHWDYYSRTSGLSKPVFCGEVGSAQRRPGDDEDRDKPFALTDADANFQESLLSTHNSLDWRYRRCVPTLHYTVWTSVLAGGAGTPLAWADGKEFGEMAARDGNPRFSAENYEVDYYAALDAVQAVFDAVSLEARLPSMTTISRNDPTTSNVWIFVLRNDSNALVWLIRTDPSADLPADVDLTSQTFAAGNVRWFNPWTGAEIGSALDVANLGETPTRLDQVSHARACTGSTLGVHQQEDVLLWITAQ